MSNGKVREDGEITIADVTAYVRKNVACPLCQGAGKTMLTNEAEEYLWVAPRPCPICRGVGQVHTRRLPISQEEITEAMMNYKFK
jgi:DnaJ-class molecular chaperone